jgi:RNA polymerase primary sigma factor
MTEVDPILEAYFRDVPKIRLSQEEEIELSSRIKKGDKTAQDRLIKANLLFVVKVAKKYANQSVHLSDLISIGNIGLIKAARTFDGKKNFKFITYAVWWIRHHILTELADQARVVRVPVNVIADLYRMKKVRDSQSQRTRNRTNLNEIAEITKMKEKSVVKLYNLDTPPLYLNAPIGDSETELIDCMPVVNQEEYITEEKMLYLRSALDQLDDRERAIMSEYYGIDTGKPMMLRQLADRYGITRERVRQIKIEALQKMRQLMTEQATL